MQDSAAVRFDAPEDFLVSRPKHGPEKARWYRRLARFMPRSASRLTLEIVSVRLERLQAITEADAIAEGVEITPVADLASRVLQFQGKGVQVAAAVVAYAHLWETINGPGSWAANDWVWVVEFKRVGSEVKA